MWLLFAILSAVFAAAISISNLATAIRTIVGCILLLAGALVMVL